MKILQVTNAYPTENLPVYGIFIKEQIDSLVDLGIKSDIYFINGREKGKFEYYKAYRELKKIVNNYDIVHCHHFLTALVVLATKPDSKVIVTFLSDGIKEFIKPDNPLFNKIIKQKLYNYILRKSDACIFKNKIPDIQASSLKPQASNFFYLPNGVNTEFFKLIDKTYAKQQLGLDVSKNYILFASLVDINRNEKRHDIFLDTMKVLKEKYKRDDIVELVISNVKRSEVPLYFNAASLHLLTSDFEGSPNSVKESLACNTPVVSTDVGNVKKMLEGLKNSYVCESNSPEKLAELVIKSLDNKTEEDSRKLIIDKKLDLKSKAHELKNIYELLMNQ